MASPIDARGSRWGRRASGDLSVHFDVELVEIIRSKVAIEVGVLRRTGKGGGKVVRLGL